MSKNWLVTRDKYLTQTEVQKLYAALKDARDLALHRRAFYHHIREYYFLRTLFETGLRVFELTRLNIADFQNGVLIVRHGKGDKRRQVMLANGTQRMLEEFLRMKADVLREPTGVGDPLFSSARKKAFSTGGIRKRVKYWFAKIGVRGSLSVHGARHTYAAHMIASGVQLPLVRDQLGHASLATTSVYAHSLVEELGELEIYK